MRNDDYWGEKPTVPEIIFHFANGNQLITMMIQGKIDICDTGNQTLANTAEQMGLNVRQMRNFYGERDIFLIYRQGLSGNFTSLSGLNLWRVQYDETLRYGSPDEPSTLNPDLIKDTAGLKIADQILEGLTVQQTRGRQQPCLAVRWPRDIDRKGWTIHLHQNVKFHDGVPLNAEAVVANLTRHRM
jgi:ABC-type transport system substrate-binding protein